MPNIVTTKEVSQYLKLTESTIYKLASIGEIPAFKIGKSWRFDMDEIIKQIRNKNTARSGRETGQKKAAGFKENNSSGNKGSL
ncbi:MAG: helix-turn-helix domain-containing protein [Deltaproteobacteria bacterium]|nr:helix-turn-helix domain-containing protein [Deltaproteobacteria bacterium]